MVWLVVSCCATTCTHNWLCCYFEGWLSACVDHERCVDWLCTRCRLCGAITVIAMTVGAALVWAVALGRCVSDKFQVHLLRVDHLFASLGVLLQPAALHGAYWCK